MRRLKAKKYKEGQAVILSVLCFLVLSGVLIAGIAVPTGNQIKSASEATKARQSYLAADSANDDALYRLNQGWTLPASFSLPFSTGVTSLATVSTNGSGQTEISVVGDAGMPSRASKSVVSFGGGVSFNYGAQVGTGGIDLSSSYITGNVYANGNITMANPTSYITGSATVANDSYPDLEQTNPLGTVTDVVFGQTAALQDVAQGFQISTTDTVSFLRVYLKKTGSPSDITLRIVTNSGSNPGGTTLATKTITAASVTTSFDYIPVPLTTPITLTPGTQYWLVLDYGTNHSTKYYTTKVSAGTYGNGVAKSGAWSSSTGGTWGAVSPSNGDMVFDLYAGGTMNKIQGQTSSNRLSIGTSGTGAAWAYEVTNVNVSGNAYCQTGTALYNLSGSTPKSCISQTSAPVLDYPITDANITEWKNVVTDATDAISGGWTYTGNLTVNFAGTTTSSLKRVVGNLSLQCNSDKPATFGDMYITGNLSVSSGCVAYFDTLKVDGNISMSSPVTVGLTKVGGTTSISSNTVLTIKNTFWSVGTITMGGGHIILDSSLNTDDGLVISDGRIDGSSGSGFAGSGTSGSYLLAISLSDCPGNCGGASSAVSLVGDTGAVSIFAPYGTVALSGGSHLKQVTAERLTLVGGSSVDYESGLADIDFDSGPSSGWVVESWDEVGQ